MSEFVNGFIAGAKVTPRGYFAPLVAFWSLLIDVTESLVHSREQERL